MTTTMIKRFEQEAQMTATLQSEHSIHLYDFGVTDDGGVVRGDLDPVQPVELLEPLEAYVGRVDRARRDETRSEESLDQRLTHVAAADEPDGEALDRHRSPAPGSGRGVRGPKIAVPTRTIVAPSSIATSKSPLIPIESSLKL